MRAKSARLYRQLADQAFAKVPWRLVTLVFALLTMLCAGLVGYDYGYQRGLGLHQALLMELGDLRERRRLSEKALAELSQRLVHQRQSARIDRAAAEQVRADMVASEARLAALREELVFYRGLMSPASAEQGLGIRSFQLSTGEQSGHFRYEVVMQQLAVDHKLLKGQLNLTVVGRLGEESIKLTLAEVSPATVEGRVHFQFKYFERIEGELALPEGFKPEGVDLSVRTWGRPVQRLDQSFPWRVEGG
jgi:hypothetical protein